MRDKIHTTLRRTDRKGRVFKSSEGREAVQVRAIEFGTIQLSAVELNSEQSSAVCVVQAQIF